MNSVCICACGRAYTAIWWALLPLAGHQHMPWGEVLELRHCVCGSTRAVQICTGEADEAAA